MSSFRHFLRNIHVHHLSNSLIFSALIRPNPIITSNATYNTNNPIIDESDEDIDLNHNESNSVSLDVDTNVFDIACNIKTPIKKFISASNLCNSDHDETLSISDMFNPDDELDEALACIEQEELKQKEAAIQQEKEAKMKLEKGCNLFYWLRSFYLQHLLVFFVYRARVYRFLPSCCSQYQSGKQR